MRISIYLNLEETLRIADFIGIDKERIASGEITSLSIYGDFKEEEEEE